MHQSTTFARLSGIYIFNAMRVNASMLAKKTKKYGPNGPHSLPHDMHACGPHTFPHQLF